MADVERVMQAAAVSSLCVVCCASEMRIAVCMRQYCDDTAYERCIVQLEVPLLQLCYLRLHASFILTLSKLSDAYHYCITIIKQSV
jgi:hypothetical protein